MKKKNLIATAGVVFLAGAMLAGCAGNGGADGSAGKNETKESSAYVESASTAQAGQETSKTREQTESAKQTESTKQTESAKQIKDGTYSIELTFAGGSGKSKVVSPATVTVAGSKVTATIEWNSPNYDYMIVAGEKYLPVNADTAKADGKTVFEIPVVFDETMNVIGDTIAMSKAHEIEYTLVFHSNTIKPVG